ncbi:AMP-binding protein [Streptomyces sp. NPDC127068]|uniref:AMP-binding protein n=1 Tax=Streptomyces sp. NPDC127068 TaxID=3347127 RepID=UPI00365082B1
MEEYADDDPAHEYLGSDGRWTSLNRHELSHAVRSVAAGLSHAGLRAGDRLAMLDGDPASFVPAFLGALWAGVVPVPAPAPPMAGRQRQWSELLRTVLSVARPTALCVPAAASEALRPFGRLLFYEDLTRTSPTSRGPVRRSADDVVYLQFSSGSTTRPRAVAARAEAVMTNGLAIARQGIGVDLATDRTLSWLPLHHDMGLVGFVVAPLTVGLPTSFMPTRTFARDPGSWMRAMHERSATVTFAPNFAYALAARRTRPEHVAALDLSRVRVAGCGGEPINPRVLRRFAETFGPAGLNPHVMLPCYGLAESTLAVTLCPPGRPLALQRVSLKDLSAGRAAPAPNSPAGSSPSAEPLTEVVGCGKAFDDHELSVRDSVGRPLPDRLVGEVWVRGPSVAHAYAGDPEATSRTFDGEGWLHTGDRGFLVDGELFVTGRVKDLLIVRGHNTDPQRVEWIVESQSGVRQGGVAAFTRPAEETEELVLVIECRASADRGGLAARVRTAISEKLTLSVHDVVLVRPGTIPRTTSGKLRRQETRRRYLEGELDGVRQS